MTEDYQIAKTIVDNLSMSDQLLLLDHLIKTYNLSTITDYAKRNNISRQCVYDQLKKETIAYVELGGQKYLF